MMVQKNRKTKMFLRIGIFYVLTWFFLMLLGGIQQTTGVLPQAIDLPQWGPGIAALLMLMIFRKDGHKIAFFSKETPVLRYLYAALIPIGVGSLIYLISTFMHIESAATAPAYGPLWLMVLWMPFGALGEEIGWRGYLHKKLDSHMHGLFSSLLVGFMWFPIHIPFLTQGLVSVFFLALLIISFSIVIYALVQDTGFSVLLAAIFHLSINLTNLLFLDVIYETRFMMVNALVWAVVAMLVILMKKEIFLSLKS
jgi:membrane protease YdiL (CAAX protease family)